MELEIIEQRRFDWVDFDHLIVGRFYINENDWVYQCVETPVVTKYKGLCCIGHTNGRTDGAGKIHHSHTGMARLREFHGIIDIH